MRAVVQRVTRAEVRVEGEVVGSVGPGLCALVGVADDDDCGVADRLASKLWKLRVLADEHGVMNRSLADVAAAGGRPEVLVVSQFTLYGDTTRGRRPSWHRAARPEVAEPLVDRVAAELQRAGAEVATGRFGADMALELINDGPVTLVVEVEPRPGPRDTRS